MNKVILMGRLTKEPALRFTPNNKAVCKFSIAVKRGFKKQGEEQKTDFFMVVVWEKLAAFCNNYFTKGQRISIEGMLETRTWEDRCRKKMLLGLSYWCFCKLNNCYLIKKMLK